MTFPVFSPLFSSSIDAFCQTLVDTLEGTPGLRYVWSAFKPLLQGKVLYTPDTPAARLMVKEASLERGMELICMHADFSRTRKVASSVKAENTFFFVCVDLFEYLVHAGSGQLQVSVIVRSMKAPPVTLNVTQSYHLGKNNTIVSQEACSQNAADLMYFHDMTFLQDISIILISA